MSRRRVPQTVVLLGFASMLNDASSDIIYPLLPIFLTTYVGATPLIIGVIEGASDALASVLKLIAGTWSDRASHRKGFVVGGYALAGASRILIAAASHWSLVLGARLADRTGKGIRSAPRDALIADVTPMEDRGRAFGLQRAMDHTGAVAGPLIAFGLLAAGFSLRAIFVFAILPTILGVLLLMVSLREPERKRAAAAPVGHEPLPSSFRKRMIPIALFYLANSSDMFLILHAHEVGLSIEAILLLWAANHGVQAALGTHAGALSDRFGRRRMLVAGWLLYALLYAIFPFVRGVIPFLVVFVLYALPFAMTEGAEKAWIAEPLDGGSRGRGFGLYFMTAGFSTLAGGALFGLLYQAVAPMAAFMTGAALAAAAAMALVATRGPRPAAS
ncbi:MAG TPA: MFS transporter [Thermoanaerobaculia bacterium]|nr:MFS transporter [Thermoanaerobaculia bacterium]